MYNDSGAAEKAWDNLYDRNEDVQPKDCPDCQGQGLYSFSRCCGADVQHGICQDCCNPSSEIVEDCEVCKGEGVI